MHQVEPQRTHGGVALGVWVGVSGYVLFAGTAGHVPGHRRTRDNEVVRGAWH